MAASPVQLKETVVVRWVRQRTDRGPSHVCRKKQTSLPNSLHIDSVYQTQPEELSTGALIRSNVCTGVEH